MGVSSGCLPRVTLSPAGGDASPSDRFGRWPRSSSMETVDLDTEPSTPLADEVFRDEMDSKSIARSVGLNISMYRQQPPEIIGPPVTKSVSKSILWSPMKTESKSKSKTESKISSKPDIKLSNISLPPASPEQLLSQEDYADQPYGSITFTASYYQKNRKLCIELTKLENLPPKDVNTVYDVVVRLSILPSDKQTKTTQILRGSLSPIVEETFHFSVKEPAGKVVRLSVFNAVLQGKHDAIGHALFNVENVINGRPQKYSMKLSRESQPPSANCGSLQVYLHLTHEQRLIIDIIQARNLSVSHILKSSRSGEKFNTYVKITLYCAGQKMKSKKSSVVTSGHNPQYEYNCEFRIVPTNLNDCYIVLSIVLKVNLRKDVTLGRYILGPQFFSEGCAHTPWGRVVLNHEEVCHWFHMYL